VGEHCAADATEKERPCDAQSPRPHDDQVVLAGLGPLQNRLGCRAAADDGGDAHVIRHPCLRTLDDRRRLALELLLPRIEDVIRAYDLDARRNGDADQRQTGTFDEELLDTIWRGIAPSAAGDGGP